MSHLKKCTQKKRMGQTNRSIVIIKIVNESSKDGATFILDLFGFSLDFFMCVLFFSGTIQCQ